MENDLYNLFMETDRYAGSKSREETVRALFGYPGGKTKSVNRILPELPHTDRYVEPFGGSAAVLLAREPSKLEVYNDRYGGVVAFYRCLRDPIKFQKLCDWLELTIHSREDFNWCKQTWDNVACDVERAARWYYMISYSFGSLCRNFGRSTSTKSMLCGMIQKKLKLFPGIHKRLQNVQIENQDWYQCMIDYDHQDTVFYIDPPYLDTDSGIYKNKMTHEDHRKILETVFSLKGFVALSGYSNPLYDSFPWDRSIAWDVAVSIQSAAHTENNHKQHLVGLDQRGQNTEVLWIKEAS